MRPSILAHPTVTLESPPPRVLLGALHQSCGFHHCFLLSCSCPTDVRVTSRQLPPVKQPSAALGGGHLDRRQAPTFDSSIDVREGNPVVPRHPGGSDVIQPNFHLYHVS